MANISKEEIAKQKEERLKTVVKNNQGCCMHIIKYDDTRNVYVEFTDKYKYIVHTNYKSFKNGSVRNPYYNSYYEVACIGNTKTVDSNGKIKKSYASWQQMIRRCYDKKASNHKYYGGNEVYVCDEWLCYENFEIWFNKNYYLCKDDVMVIDKDMLFPYNKCYCPSKCCILPQRINTLILKERGCRGKYLIGVSYIDRLGKFTAQGNFSSSTNHYIGIYDTEIEAFFAYKEAKERYIKDVVLNYKLYIPSELYDALYKYEIKITD